jgi:hypothetical protein
MLLATRDVTYRCHELVRVDLFQDVAARAFR